MQIHELKPKHALRKEKRIGRGGKRGTTSGGGQKGQKSRAGHKIRPAQRDMIQRLPKLRGVKNPPKKRGQIVIIHTSRLESVAENKAISPKILKGKGIIKKDSDPVKILFDKEPGAAFAVTGLRLSEKAKAAILKAGGTVA
ncbi:uL15 family ribosomal protein [Patescibacteria group bacterium]|jgi:large subunit ribosomal protein L15|nr:uL15 family ribosomal protein [Patescibacteria group bacterium]MCL5114779.1 uL15 family ribosomal protein [Patescibacteria group bacterium]